MSKSQKKKSDLDDLALELTPEPGEAAENSRVEPEFSVPEGDEHTDQDPDLGLEIPDAGARKVTPDDDGVIAAEVEDVVISAADDDVVVGAGNSGNTDFATPTSDRPVPRISIEAFCLRPDTGVTLQRAAVDRRLSRTHTSVHMGGIPTAVEHFSDTSTPNLLIVETMGDFNEISDGLNSLAQVCDPGTKVVVIGQLNDISVYRELIRQGISEYLVAPLTVPQIIDSISGLFVDPDQPAIGRTIVFTGAKGGAGSSTVAHNASWFIAETMLEDVTLVDLDLPFGTAGLDFNHDPAQGVADALTAPERLDDQLLERLLVKCSERLSLFTAPGTLDRDFDLATDSFDRVLDVVRESVPCIAVDLPHIWEPWTRRILLTADEIVITATPDLASLRNTKNLVDLLKQSRKNDHPPRLVLNQVGVPKRPEIPIKDFAEAVSLEPELVMPFDPNLFGVAANNGQMIAELKPEAKVAHGLKGLASTLVGKEAIDVKRSFLKKFADQLMGRE